MAIKFPLISSAEKESIIKLYISRICDISAYKEDLIAAELIQYVKLRIVQSAMITGNTKNTERGKQYVVKNPIKRAFPLMAKIKYHEIQGFIIISDYNNKFYLPFFKN